MTEQVITLPKWSDDPKAYARAYMRRKRLLDQAFARRQADSARRWQIENPVRNARNQYRQSARKKGIAWELADDQFAALVLADCHYCGGAAPVGGINGVDRVDNSHGYVTANVVSACAQCNYAKRDYELPEFLAWAKRLAAHQEDLHG